MPMSGVISRSANPALNPDSAARAGAMAMNAANAAMNASETNRTAEWALDFVSEMDGALLVTSDRARRGDDDRCMGFLW